MCNQQCLFAFRLKCVQVVIFSLFFKKNFDFYFRLGGTCAGMLHGYIM